MIQWLRDKQKGVCAMTRFAYSLLFAVAMVLPSITLLAQTTHDPGYPEERTWLDINGDFVPDYCRIVGNPGHYQIACAISVRSGPSVTFYSLYSSPATPVDRGYPASGGFYSPQP